MDLPRPIIWLLTAAYGLCFAGFASVGFLAMTRGCLAHEYEPFGVGSPKVLAVLLAGMAISAVLPWAHYRRDSYTAFEETFYGVLLGIAAFGLVLVVPLVLTAPAG